MKTVTRAMIGAILLSCLAALPLTAGGQGETRCPPSRDRRHAIRFRRLDGTGP